MEQVRTNAGQTLGIIGLILGILCLFLAFIPCIGFLAIAPGVIAIILSAIGLNQANRNNGAKGLNIGALIVSILGVAIASVWLIFFVGIASLNEDEIENIVEEVIEEVIEETTHNPDLQDALDELEEHLDEICVDSLKIKTDSVSVNVKIKVEREK